MALSSTDRQARVNVSGFLQHDLATRFAENIEKEAFWALLEGLALRSFFHPAHPARQQSPGPAPKTIFFLATGRYDAGRRAGQRRSNSFPDQVRASCSSCRRSDTFCTGNNASSFGIWYVNTRRRHGCAVGAAASRQTRTEPRRNRLQGGPARGKETEKR